MQIPGAEKVVSIFGRWPSFHDAEVIRFVLERSDPYAAGPSIFVDVHAFEMTSEIAADGIYVLKHHTLISFHFAGVVEVQLEEFNNQNVLRDLDIIEISDRQMELLKYEVHFDSTFGLDARFLCREVTITNVQPWNAIN